MLPVEFLFSIYPLSSQGLPDVHRAKAKQLQQELIQRTYSDALMRSGITAASAKKIAADYYVKTYGNDL